MAAFCFLHLTFNWLLSQSHRYSKSSADRQVVLAKLALVMDGADFALKQITAAISAFARSLLMN